MWVERFYSCGGKLLSLYYWVVGKLGFDMTSTMARATATPRALDPEFGHRGEKFTFERANCVQLTGKVAQRSTPVRSLLDSFTISGPGGEHLCFIHQRLWGSLRTFLVHNPADMLPTVIPAYTLHPMALQRNVSRFTRPLENLAKQAL
jgi:serine/threonine-protein kinase SRPK3